MFIYFICPSYYVYTYIAEPILLTEGNSLSKDGLGMKEKIATEARIKRVKLEDKEVIKRQLHDNFLATVSTKFRAHIIDRDVKSAECAIELLDGREEIGIHELWSARSNDLSQQEKKEDIDGTDESNKKEVDSSCNIVRLDACLRYLRLKHLYCLYCGFAYDNLCQLNTSCPGMYESDH